MPELWPHQRRGVEKFIQAVNSGRRSTCITSPTGGGKSLMMMELIDVFESATIYSNRRVLTQQLIETLERRGMQFGVRAAGYGDYMRPAHRVQISSIQTEASRVYKQKRWTLTKPKITIIDEWHLQARGQAEKTQRDHLEQGSILCGFTATPIGISHLAEELVVAGTNSELRDCGAHVVCKTFEPCELDWEMLKPTKSGDFAEGAVEQVWTPQIIGPVIENYNTLNPERRPAICCCPSVATAAWMADQFTQQGIRAACLDGEEITIDGVREQSTPDARNELMNRFRAGEIKVITFRYVLREAWDFPELYHLILATPIGSVVSYLQVVGRLLRNHPSLDHVILQDHGGNFARHGSPNMNRDWSDIWKLSANVIASERADVMREKPELQPIVCEKCFASRNGGAFCHHCGHQSKKRMRRILQNDGTLRLVEGDVFKPHVIKVKHDTQKLWDSMFFRSLKSNMTFRQARGLFFRENHYYPPNTLVRMPVKPRDWFAVVGTKGIVLHGDQAA